jgi:VanZ family protein
VLPCASSILFPSRRLRVLAVAAFVAAAALLLHQGAQPHAVGLIPAPWDKLAHLGVFGAFAATAWVALGGVAPLADRLAPALALAIGVVDEIAQGFAPGRHVDATDLLADAAGALLAVWLLARLRDRRAATRRSARSPAPSTAARHPS